MIIRAHLLGASQTTLQEITMKTLVTALTVAALTTLTLANQSQIPL